LAGLHFLFAFTKFRPIKDGEFAEKYKPTVLSHHHQASKVCCMKTPQQLSRAAIEELRAIYQEEFGKSLSDDEVQEIALRLLRFFGILN